MAMRVLFDMQDELANVDDISDVSFVVPIGTPSPMLILQRNEDVNIIHITKRENHDAGLGISLRAIPGLMIGDRITVTGRIGSGAPTGSVQWGVALMVSQTEAGQLAQQTAPKSLFSLSCLLDEADLTRVIMLQATRWGSVTPVMDIMIDTVLITRGEKPLHEPIDTRTTVYNLEVDPGIQWVGERDSQTFESSGVLRRSGSPTLSIFRRGDSNAIHVGNRKNDWDGVDIDLEALGLMTANNYLISVSGRVEGAIPTNTPKGIRFMIQGMPGYSWRDAQVVGDDQEFTISHVMSPSEIEKWKFVRITSDSAGALVPFYVYGIEIKRLV